MTQDRAARVLELPALDDDPSFEVPASWVGSLNPGRRGVRVLLVVLAVVVGVSGFIAWRAVPKVTAAPPVAAVSQAAPASSPALLVVDVQGRVVRPGLVRVPAGGRVADALALAGGALPGTDLAGLNLARKVLDGELIMVGASPPPHGPGGAPQQLGLVNLNTATIAELQTLPGIGEVLAQRIIDYRDGHGGFHAVTDLHHVDGIGEAKFAQLKDRVTV